MRTELVWDGKYDEFGNRREVDFAACGMPMQKIETVVRLFSASGPDVPLGKS